MAERFLKMDCVGEGLLRAIGEGEVNGILAVALQKDVVGQITLVSNRLSGRGNLHRAPPLSVD